MRYVDDSSLYSSDLQRQFRQCAENERERERVGTAAAKGTHEINVRINVVLRGVHNSSKLRTYHFSQQLDPIQPAVVRY